MMGNNRHAVTMLCLTLVPCIVAGCAGEKIRMATGGSTATYYSFGSVVGQILTEHTKIPITIQSTGASKANIQLIDSGEVEIAIVQNDIMDYAWKGIDLFNGEKITSFACMAALFAEACQVIANPASGIRTIADLKGRNVAVGDAGSGTEFNARQILEAYGIGFGEIRKQNLSFGASADALRDNKIDAFFCVAGAPTPAIVDLAINKNVIFLDIDDAHAEKLINKYPFYTQFAIPSGSYKGQNDAVQTLAVKAAFIVSAKLKEETVYQLTKALFENKAQIEAAHVKGSELSPSYAVEGISVPFHPGAEKYYREIGALNYMEVRDTVSGKVYGSWPLNGGEFSVEFVHSVNQSPVRETFCAAGKEIGLNSVRFFSFGAGMQSDLEEGQTMSRDGDALVISGINRSFTELNYIVGTESDHRLFIDGETVSLTGLASAKSRGKNAHITLRIQ